MLTLGHKGIWGVDFMKRDLAGAVLSALIFASPVFASPALAQETAPTAAEPAATQAATPPAEAAPACELHVWPTDNYVGINTGLLSGFGALGAVADIAAHDGRVKTVKDLMRDYLGPDIQIEELNRQNFKVRLGKADYAVIIEEPTPFNEDLKNNPELKAKVKAMNAKLKSGERLTASTNACYAEFLTTMIFYHKAMMYGSNLFTGFVFRDYAGQPGNKPKQSVGAVKNPLENFPPKTPEMVDAAKAELRDAFAKDFVEWSEKKLVK